MAINDQTIQLAILKAILEKLPFGVLVTRNESDIVLCSRVLSESLSENQRDLQMSMIIRKDLTPGVNTPIQLNGNHGIVRKEFIKVLEEGYQLYLLL
ncbi:hypothetical protein ELQ35_21055 [Peribacillus cavernae]|uniref:Uncharacterized protein n=1 Tax=Peribacillus cavernae TaxID=1674310 RepID=A0A3S1B0V9_9BACI|nr:hypothetical protein [Peribacillus cavernae]MDQ0220843.1 hypothetical protein [Peribacillus cavernae]RUQ24851.1 hypothetical protein ELQ35_21055 [Peribacillus cavernae]